MQISPVCVYNVSFNVISYSNPACMQVTSLVAVMDIMVSTKGAIASLLKKKLLLNISSHQGPP